MATRRSRRSKSPKQSEARRAPRGPALRAHAALVLDRLLERYPDAHCALDFTNAVRAARRDDPQRAVHRQAREHGHAGAVRALSRRRTRSPRATPGGRRGDRSRAPASSATRRRASSAWRRPSSSTTAARCRRHGRRSSMLPGVGRKTANVMLGNAFGTQRRRRRRHARHAPEQPARPHERNGRREDRAGR